MMLGTVRLWASKDMACGEKKGAHKHTKTPRRSHTHKQKVLICAEGECELNQKRRKRKITFGKNMLKIAAK